MRLCCYILFLITLTIPALANTKVLARQKNTVAVTLQQATVKSVTAHNNFCPVQIEHSALLELTVFNNNLQAQKLLSYPDSFLYSLSIAFFPAALTVLPVKLSGNNHLSYNYPFHSFW